MKKPSAKSIARQKRRAKVNVHAARRRSRVGYPGLAPAMLLGALGLPAIAAETRIDFRGEVYAADGHLLIDSVQINPGNIAASILDGSSSITGDVLDGSEVTFDVEDNVFAALASGNSFVNAIELNLIEGAGGAGGDGAASLGFSLNEGSISTAVEQTGFSETLTGFDDGSFSVSANLVLAQTTINAGESTVFGSVPTGYADSTAGSIALNFESNPGNDLASTASVAVSSFQVSEDAGQASGSGADVDDNFATLSLDAATGVALSIDSTLLVDGNEFSASFRGNVASSSVPIDAAENSTFEGTVALSNTQAILDTGNTSGTAALNRDTMIAGRVGTLNTDDLTELLGTLSVSDNSVESSATANTATSSISLVDGLSYQGSAATDAPEVALGMGIAPLASATLDADLALLNAQITDGNVVFVLTDDTFIGAEVQSLNNGTVVVDGNAVGSSVAGNIGTNDITAGRANFFEGSVSLGSLQLNEDAVGTLFNETFTRGTEVIARIGNAGVADAGLTGSAVSVTGTSVTASATGNRVSNAVDLAGNTLALGEVGSGASFGDIGGGQEVLSEMTIGADVSLANLQANSGVSTLIEHTATEIGIIADDLAAPISGSNLDVSGSVVDSVAIGSEGSNALALSANALSGSAGLGSVQAFEGGAQDEEVRTLLSRVDLFVLANVDEPQAVNDSTLNLSNNLVRGLAFVNSAGNAVTLSANSATIPVGAGTDASVVDFDIANANQQVDAAYGLLGVQSSSGSVEVVLGPVLFDVQVGSDLNRSTIASDGNAVVAAAFGNDGSNDMRLDASNLTLAGDSGAVANVTNVQGFSSSVDVARTFVASTVIRTTIDGDVAASTVTVDDNLVQTQAVGNRAAGNALSVTGTNISALPDAPLDGLSVDADGITADTMFSLQNAQIFGAGAQLRINMSPAAIDFIANADLLQDSTIAVDDNAILASGTLNQASNALALTGITTLEAAAGLNSYQEGVGSVRLDMSAPQQRIFVGDVGIAGSGAGVVQGSSLSIADNVQQGAARANLSANGVSVEATNVIVPTNAAAASVIGAGGDTATVAAAFGSLNTQTQTGGVGASAIGGRADLFVAGGITDSTLAIDRNVFATLAAANTTTNAMDLALGNLTVAGGGEGAIGAVTSNQSLDGAVEAEVISQGSAGSTAILRGFEGVENSTFSVADNLIQTEAFGNRALDGEGMGNELIVSGGSIEATLTDAAGLSMPSTYATQTADLAFTVQNRQTTEPGSDVSGLLRNIGLLAGVDGDASNSTLSVRDNRASASASSNVAGNRLEMTELNAIDSSAGVQSLQQAQGATSADAEGFILPATSFEVAVGGSSVSNSTLEVVANRVDVAATANEVRNTLLADANGITGGAGLGASTGSSSVALPGDLTGVADFAVSSVQDLSGAGVSAAGESRFAIVAGEDAADLITDSTLLITGNVQDVRAQGNVGINVLDLAATNLGDATVAGSGASGTLASIQLGGAPITATAAGFSAGPGTFSMAEAPGSMANSTLRISANENRATAILNDSANRLSVTGTNLRTSADNSDNASAVDGAAVSATADQGLLNFQLASGGSAISADATSTLQNAVDLAPANTTGISGSSAELFDNLNEARATANRSSNVMQLDASNLGVTGTVASRQENNNSVTSTATSTVRFALNNDDGAVTTDSTISVRGNSTVAASSGNRATNVLEAMASAGYQNVDVAGATGSISAAARSTAATFGVLNSQTNDNSIAATIDGAAYAIAFTGTADAVSGSTLLASGNQMIAEASGNFASNRLSLSARPGGNGSAALTNFQSNTGANISATLSNSSMSVSIDGTTGVSGNTAAVSGNRGIARATGNTAVNRILSGD